MNQRNLLLTVLLCLPCFALAETYAIVNAKVHTLSSKGTLQDTTIVIDDGRVTDLGPGARVPASAEVIDAEGHEVTPGIFDPISYLGIVEIGGVEQSVDDALANSYGPAFSVADAINPRSTLIAINRIEGVTRAVVVPDATEGSGILVGQAAAISLGGTDDYLVDRRAAMVVFLGEAGSGIAGGSRSGALLRLKEALQDARDFKANRDAYDAAQRRGYALSRLDLEALQGVIEGEVPLLTFVNRASDIQSVLEFADEYDVKVIIVGGAEAWLVAGQLAAANVGVILNPLTNLPGSFESLNASIENAARLHEAGVPIAFAMSDSHNARNLTQLAGNAVAHGLPWEAALRAITVNPAAMFGQDNKCCTIEVGKETDLVIWDGDPLEVTSFPTQVIIAGEMVPMTSRQTLLRDRYLELDSELPPAYRHP